MRNLPVPSVPLSSLQSLLMLPGNRRYIPPPIKELMVTLQTKKRMKKSQVAALLDVSPLTVRRVTKLKAETGSVVRPKSLVGAQRTLNGVDCAVRQCQPIPKDLHVLI